MNLSWLKSVSVSNPGCATNPLPWRSEKHAQRLALAQRTFYALGQAAGPRFVSLSFPFEVVYHQRRNRKNTMSSRLTFFVVAVATLLSSGQTARSSPPRTLTFAER